MCLRRASSKREGDVAEAQHLADAQNPPGCEIVRQQVEDFFGRLHVDDAPKSLDDPAIVCVSDYDVNP